MASNLIEQGIDIVAARKQLLDQAASEQTAEPINSLVVPLPDLEKTNPLTDDAEQRAKQ